MSGHVKVSLLDVNVTDVSFALFMVQLLVPVEGWNASDTNVSHTKVSGKIVSFGQKKYLLAKQRIHGEVTLIELTVNGNKGAFCTSPEGAPCKRHTVAVGLPAGAAGAPCKRHTVAVGLPAGAAQGAS